MEEVSFTDRELDVMDVLWRSGSATVAEAREALEDDLAYTTVLTLFQTLEEKGHVRHEKEGRAYRYFPTVDREAAGANAVRYLLRKVFRGSPELLLTHVLRARDLAPSELRRLRALLDERLAPGEGEEGEAEEGGDP